MSEPTDKHTLQKMAKEDYYHELLRITGIKDAETKTPNRELKVTIAHDNYGRPSSVIIAFNGSSPRMEVYFRIGFNGHPIIVRGEVFKPGRTAKAWNRYTYLFHFLSEFIKPYIDESDHTLLSCPGE